MSSYGKACMGGFSPDMRDFNPQSAVKKKRLTPRTSKKNRQASDAKWRANMLMCFNLLKHATAEKPIEVLKPKLTSKLSALKKATDLIPRLEGIVLELLLEKSTSLGTGASLDIVRQEFRSISDAVHCQIEVSTKKCDSCKQQGKISSDTLHVIYSESSTTVTSSISSSTDAECREMTLLADPVKVPSVSCTSDIASDSALQHGLLQEADALLHMSMDWEGSSANDTLSMTPVILYDNEEFVDLSQFSPQLTPRARQAFKEDIILMSPSCRKILFHSNPSNTHEEVRGEDVMLVNDKSCESLKMHYGLENAEQHCDRDLDFWSDDERKSSYDHFTGQRTRILRTDTDPMVSSVINQWYPEGRRFRCSDSLTASHISSPWKAEELDVFADLS